MAGKVETLIYGRCPRFKGMRRYFRFGIASLKAGDALKIINDHDPKPLWYQFEVSIRTNMNGTTNKGPKD